MKRQEIVQLHGLLAEVRSYLERECEVPSSAFGAYDAQSVRPMHVHRRKRDHERAVQVLLDEIVVAIQSLPPPTDGVRPPRRDRSKPT